jgi:hypothetical protein
MPYYSLRFGPTLDTWDIGLRTRGPYRGAVSRGHSAGDSYAKGDVWFLRLSCAEIDDNPIVGTEIQIDITRCPTAP